MTAPAWMPFYIADYLADTSHLGALQSGAYLHLIMHYWQHHGLPDDEAGLARIARLTPAEWKRERGTLQAFFHDGWKHKRIDGELSDTAELIAAKSQAGKTGAAKRWQKNSRRIADASVRHKQNDAPLPLPSQTTSLRSVGAEPVSEERTKLDGLERELRSAAGLEADPSPALLDLSPITALLDKGYSLANDVLPKLREAKARGKTGRSWRYYLASITENKTANAAIAPKPQTTPSAPVAWVCEDDSRWKPLAERYHSERGKRAFAAGSRSETGIGFHFPSEWVTAKTPVAA